MVTINYYEDLDSYIDEKRKSTTFLVRVEFKDGKIIFSSSLPISYLPVVISTIETADAAHTALSIWDRDSKALTLIPHNNIASILIKFN